MSNYIGEELRRLVSARSKGLCEYCLIHSDDTFFGCEVDHIISRGVPLALPVLCVVQPDETSTSFV